MANVRSSQPHGLRCPSDPLATIEQQLARPIRLAEEPKWRDQRLRLNHAFGCLSPTHAQDLAFRIFSATRAGSVADLFQDLHHAVRAELLQILPRRLGHVGSEIIYGWIMLADGESAEGRRLRQRLQEVLPDKQTRETFLNALKDQFSRFHSPALMVGKDPTVKLVFRNHGTPSPDNHCTLLKSAHVNLLGSDSDPGNNWMEIRGDVIGHRDGATYKIERTIESAVWYRLNSTKWIRKSRKPPGTWDNHPDHPDSEDVDLSPEFNHIYQVDGPGFPEVPPPPPVDPKKTEQENAKVAESITDWIQMLNATQTVSVKVGTGPWRASTEKLYWHSVVWLEKVDNSWRRKPGVNEIEELHLFIGEGDPPVAIGQ